MKIIKTCVIILLLTLVTAAQGFEGYVKYKMDADGETTFMKYYKKGENVRMEPEIAAGQMGGAILFSDGKTYVMMPSQKMYMEFDMEQMASLSPEQEQDIEGAEKPTNTGETKEILGYTAEKWLMEDDDYTAEVWAAKGLGEFVMLSMPMSKDKMPDWYEDLSQGGFFPLLVIARDASGNVESRMEAVEINKEGVPDDMFAIPSDYSKFSMPGRN